MHIRYRTSLISKLLCSDYFYILDFSLCMYLFSILWYMLWSFKNFCIFFIWIIWDVSNIWILTMIINIATLKIMNLKLQKNVQNCTFRKIFFPKAILEKFISKIVSQWLFEVVSWTKHEEAKNDIFIDKLDWTTCEF